MAPHEIRSSGEPPGKITTIAAPATPPGRSGIGIIRVSGPKVTRIAEGILGVLPAPRHATYKSFRNALGEPIDDGLALFFPAPHSFTGEDILELHGHGGPVVLDSLLRRTVELGAVPAEPGEFSQRAFLNGKLDLVQAEAIADLIDSASEQAARAARESLQGRFSQAIRDLMARVLDLRTYIEAAIDFPDDEIDSLSASGTGDHLAAIGADLARISHAARQGSLLREGARIVIAGRPNVGKSTLLNALAGRDIAIVTGIPGTTRDVLREPIQLDGCPFHLFDTAGLRETRDEVEQQGVRRARDTIGQADILLLVVDENGPQPQDHEILAGFHPRPTTLIVQNKIDLAGIRPEVFATGPGIRVNLSAKTGAGLDLLREQLKTQAGFRRDTEGIFLARRRHLDALERARSAFESAGRQLAAEASELVAEDLREMQQALGEITGQYTTEDLLDRIFSGFCIGK
ncbi:MAG: tRNA modification GTPase trmE [Candidatus Kentron sp. G]|nr:MAG: tRNA modification GTPase trmE [Candidatus Kentron sp. G]VFM96409.1 MAG: tRNA modification GTPase trmE [Candidatus Kentron sp. G]VFM98517.1 MAG: tRNA modification GTPase trmE [Candidatus Kentron sp. G]